MIKLNQDNVKFIIIFFIFISCSKDKLINSNIEKNSFKNKLFTSVDYVIDSLEYCRGIDNVLQIRHQKYHGDDYVQIKTLEFLDGIIYTKDSVYCIIPYRKNLVVFYNKDYFQNKKLFTNGDSSLLEKYLKIEKSYTSIDDRRCFEIFQIKNDSFIKINHNSWEYNNFFSFPPIPPAPVTRPKQR